MRKPQTLGIDYEILDLDRDLADARTHGDSLAILKAPRSEILRMHQQPIARRTFYQTLAVVQPGVVAANVPATDEDKGVRSRRREQLAFAAY